MNIILQHNRYRSIFIYLIRQGQTVTSAQLAKELNVTTKTIKNDLKQMKAELLPFGVVLKAKPGKGYYLDIFDTTKFLNTREMFRLEQPKQIGDEQKERVRFIIRKLLGSNTIVNTQNLLEEMMLGKASLSVELKEVRNILDGYHLVLLIKPHKGIIIEGNPFYKWLLALNYRYTGIQESSYYCKEFDDLFKTSKNMTEIRSIVIRYLNNLDLVFSDVHLQRFIDALIFVSHKINAQDYLPYLQAPVEQTKEYIFVKVVTKEIETAFNFSHYLENECKFLTILCLISTDLFRYRDCTKDRYQDFHYFGQQLANAMFAVIANYFGLDMISNERMRKDFLKMCIPISVKIFFRIKEDNEIFIRYVDWFKEQDITISHCVYVVEQYFIEYYEYQMTNKEKSIVFQTIFSMFYKQEILKPKMKIVIIAVDGRLSVQPLKDYLEENFEEYVTRIETRVLYELENLDVSHIDYFLCMSYARHLPILHKPIYFIDEHLKKEDYYKTLKEVFVTINEKQLGLPSIERVDYLDIKNAFYDSLQCQCKIDFKSKMNSFKICFQDDVLKMQILLKPNQSLLVIKIVLKVIHTIILQPQLINQLTLKGEITYQKIINESR